MVTIHAVKNHGRWIVECPACHDAAEWQGREWSDTGLGLVRPENTAPDAWQCSNCGVAYNVAWPSDADRVAIEKILLARPKRSNRNWYGEDLAQLRAENVAYGCPAEVKA